ncbi:probable galacturonosyltransferase 9 [Tanacetum coccineum]
MAWSTSAPCDMRQNRGAQCFECDVKDGNSIVFPDNDGQTLEALNQRVIEQSSRSLDIHGVSFENNAISTNRGYYKKDAATEFANVGGNKLFSVVTFSMVGLQTMNMSLMEAKEMVSFKRKSDFWVGDGDFQDIHGVGYEDDFSVKASLFDEAIEYLKTLKVQVQNEYQTLWKVGTLPPGLMTFYSTTKLLDKAWYVLGLAYNPSISMDEINKAVVTHVNGDMKLWLDIAMNQFKNLWTKYVDSETEFVQI